VKRPLGVTILAILAIIGGLLSLLVAALGFLAAGVVASGALAGAYGSATAAPSTAALAFSSGSLIVLGILYLAFGIGAFMLKGWAWTAGIIALVLGIVSDIALPFLTSTSFGASSIIGIVIDLALIYYLFRPNVRTAFGK
jgi:hypothetical protein